MFNQIIDFHNNAYLNQKVVIDKKSANIEECIDIEDYLSNNRIICFKYNYSLEKHVQRLESYPCLIELSKDCQYLTFLTKRLNIKTKYVLESDPEHLKMYRIEEHKLRNSMHD